MSDDLLAAVDRIKGLIVPLLQGQSAAELGRVLVYVQSVPRSLDASRAALRALEEKEGEETDPDRDEQERRKKRAAIEQACRRGVQNSLSFARRNLDSARMQALEALVYRPRLARKADLERRALALQKSLDRMEDPAPAMLEHYAGSSDPLNKYLLAGPWGHEYLQRRKLDTEEYDTALCRLLGWREKEGGGVVMSYAPLRRAIDELEAVAQCTLDPIPGPDGSKR